VHILREDTHFYGISLALALTHVIPGSTGNLSSQ
jgi:hypothetical protein